MKFVKVLDQDGFDEMEIIQLNFDGKGNAIVRTKYNKPHWYSKDDSFRYPHWYEVWGADKIAEKITSQYHGDPIYELVWDLDQVKKKSLGQRIKSKLRGAKA
tara:strand:- start:61 stop:366 length:306 start_codon:yes stop_codon:yes gene_type:complete